jgi:hypothetical protein
LKKFIIYVLFVVTCAVSAFFVYTNMQSSQYEDTAVPYIRQILPIISTWDPVLAKDYMATEVLARVTPAELESLMLTLSQIGELKSIDKVKFKNKASGENVTLDKYPLVSYTLETQYTSGRVKVTISLLDKGDSFEVFHFNFQTAALTQ